MYSPENAPQIVPAAQNLLAAANIVTQQEGEWMNGVSFTPLGCHTINGECDVCPPAETDDWQTCASNLVFKPYYLWTAMEVPAMDYLAHQALLLQLVETGTSAKLESMIWNGCGEDDADTPVLTDATAVTGSAVSPAKGLAYIVAALNDSDEHVTGQGTIHVSSFDAVTLYDHFTLDGDFYRTNIGNHAVVIGNYPAGTLVGHLGEVDVYLSPPALFEAPERVRGVNLYTAQANRAALAVWNSCAAYKQAIDWDA